MVKTVVRASEVKQWVAASVCAKTHALNIVDKFEALHHQILSDERRERPCAIVMMPRNQMLGCVCWVVN